MFLPILQTLRSGSLIKKATIHQILSESLKNGYTAYINNEKTDKQTISRSESGGKHNQQPIGIVLYSLKKTFCCQSVSKPRQPSFHIYKEQSRRWGEMVWAWKPENRHVLMPTDQRGNNVEILEATEKHKRNTHKQSLMRQWKEHGESVRGCVTTRSEMHGVL